MAAVTHRLQMLVNAALCSCLFSASARPASRIEVGNCERDHIIRVAGRVALPSRTTAFVESAFACTFTLALRSLDANVEAEGFPVSGINVLLTHDSSGDPAAIQTRSQECEIGFSDSCMLAEAAEMA
jgi:hypothetical protein